MKKLDVCVRARVLSVLALLTLFVGHAKAVELGRSGASELLNGTISEQTIWPDRHPFEAKASSAVAAFSVPAATTMFHDPAPTSIVFSILNTTCGGQGPSYSFILNGVTIGTAVADDQDGDGFSDSTCSCSPVIQTVSISDASAIASAWNETGSNELRFVKDSGNYFSWVSGQLNFASGPVIAFYDERGGNATDTNLCAGYTDIPLDVALGSRFYRDADADGFGDPNVSITTLDAHTPVGYVTDNTDFDDAHASAYPGAPEICDGIDNNGNGAVDETTRYYRDADGDGFGDKNVFVDVSACSTPPAGYVANSGDCNDSDSSITQGCRALINAETVAGGANSPEALAATAQGYQVDVVSAATWSAMTAAQFGQYSVIIAGDPYCAGVANSFTANANVWAPVVMGKAGGRMRAGNRILVGTDPVTHGASADNDRGSIIRTGIAFASKQPGTTGLFFDASCDYTDHARTLATLGLLSTGSGSWTETNDAPCGGAVSLIAAESSFVGLTSDSLQGWGCSVHETFPTFPTDWSALAVATDTPTKPSCGVDPNTGVSACGQAYILIAGSSVVVTSGSISVTPLNDTGPVNTSHTVHAHASSAGSPLINQPITFTITGVNAGVSGTCSSAGCKTDVNGDVSFSYVGGNSAGDDTIKASFTDATGSNQAATAQKHWVANAKPQATASAVDGGGVYNGTAYTGSGSCSNSLTPVITYSGGSAPVGFGATSFTVTCGDGGVKYVDGTATGSIVISKASVTATAGSGSGAYNGSPQAPADCAVAGAYTVGLSCSNNPASVGPNAGTTAIAAVVSGDQTNFDVTLAGGSYTIKPAQASATAVDGGGVYSGTAYTGSGTCSNHLSPVITYSGGGAPVNAGTSTFTVTCGDGGVNYIDGSATGSIVITKTSSTTIVTCPSNIAYTGSAITPCSASVAGAGGLAGAVTPVTYSNNTNVGTAGASASYGGDTNHNGSTGSSTFKIDAVCSAPASGLVAWYPGENNSNDIVGNVTGQSTGPSLFSPGKVGQAFNLDGTNYFSIPSTNIPVGSAARSIDFWVNVRDTSPDHEILVYGAFAFHQAFGIDVDGTTGAGNVKLQVFTYGDDISGLDTGVPLNQFMHVAVTYDGGVTLKAYINGVLKQTKTLSGPLDTQPSVVTIGHFFGNFNGLLDEAKIHDRALTAQEVNGIYNSGSLGTCQPPVTSTTVTNQSTPYSSAAQNLVLGSAVTSPSGTVNTGSVQFTVTTTGGTQVGPVVSGSVSGGTASASYTLPAGTAVQTLKVRASFTTNGALDYQSSLGGGTLTVTSVQATASAVDGGGVYNGTAYTGSGTCSNGLSPVITYAGGSAPVDFGTTSFTVTCSDGGVNYIDGTATGNIVITKANATVTVNGYTGTYDAAAHGASGSATGVGGVTLPGLSLGDSFTEVPGGTASWTFAGGNNYNDQKGAAAITINKADATVKVNGYTGTYDAAAHGASGSATGVAGVDLSSALNLGATFTDVPGGTADWTFTGGTNYNDQNGKAAIKISKADAVVKVNGYTGTYDAAAHGATGSASGVAGVDLSSALNLGATFTDVPGGTADWTFTGGTNYNGQNGKAAIKISKAASFTSVTCSGMSFVYNGTVQTPCTVSVTGAGGLNLAPTPSYTANTNVGPVTASYTYAGDANHTGSEDSKKFDITKAAVTITAGSGTATYDGSAKTPSACVVTGNYKGDLMCSNDPATVGPAAGDYTINPLVSGTGLSNFDITSVAGHAKIDQATSATVVTCTSTVVYNGTAQTPCTVAVTGAGGLNLAPTPSYTANTNVGTVTASYTYAGDANHTGSSDSKKFDITKAPVTITAGSGTATYDGSAKTPSACVVTGNYRGDLTCSNDPATVGSAAGDYTINPVVSGSALSNFDITSVAGLAKINRATSATVVTCPLAVVYNGTAQTPCTVAVTGAGGLSLAPTPSYTANTNVGAVTASYTYAGDANHTGSEDSKKFDITKAAVTITAEAKSKTYGDADPTLTYKITAGSVAPTDTFTGSLTRVAGTGVGTYAIQQGTVALSSNYDLTYVGANLTIVTRAVTITAAAKSKTYGDADPALTYSITSGNLITGDGFTGALTRVAGENAGTYAIKQGTVALNSNYTLNYSGSVLTINRASLTVTANSPTKQYSDVPAFSVSYSAFKNNEGPSVLSGTLSFTSTASFSSGAITSPAGNYTVTPGGLTSANYAISFVPGTLTVTKEDAVITYNGMQFLLLTTAGSNGSVTLSASVQEAADGSIGNTLGGKQVQFKVFKATDLTMTTPVVQPICTLANTATAGTATCSLTAALPADTYTIQMQLLENGYYMAPVEDAVLNISDPGMTTGGGWLIDPNTAANPNGDRSNYGFNVKYQKSGNAQGNSLFIYRTRTDIGFGVRDYNFVVKSNSMGSITQSTTTTPKFAKFEGKATIKAVDRLTGVVYDGGGGYLFQVDVTDKGEPGSGVTNSDTYATRITDSAGKVVILLGSYTGTTNTAQIGIKGGNIQVK
jgi:hypothetical protein